MRDRLRGLSAWLLIALLGFAYGCAATYPPGSYYNVKENPTYSGGGGVLEVGYNDRVYVLRIEDRTPFGLRDFPEAMNVLYNKGYDEVRRKGQADFEIKVILSGGVQENPEVRAGQTLGGALLGAATGAAIGAAVGDPGAGAAIGAASGGALGFVAPAATGVVRVDLYVQSFTERLRSERSRTVDLTTVPPHDVQRVIDGEIARMLQSLPNR